jgi:sugar fermentation stimulation protein A
MAKKMSIMIPIDQGATGTYTLIIELNQETEIKVGKLGVHKFPRGCYVYTGSALGKGAVGLKGRLQRHISKSKTKTIHWHIDYILNANESHINHIVFFESNKQYECMIIKELISAGGKVIVGGLGASDCQSGCNSHLLFFENDEQRIRRIVKKAYEASIFSKSIKEYSPEGIS